LKTESSFTMFSNLHTEQGSWNHLLIPEAVRVFPYQDQLVRITASNDRALEASTQDGTRLVRFDLEGYLRSHPGTTASYAMTTATGETIHTTCAPTESGRVLRSVDEHRTTIQRRCYGIQ
ncbi:MAG: hypothetical protein H0T19_06055, partial [Thermoleophilaceae bacterium]|nr:hypothetical protein [Thermoleophilaceae bacterium]